MWMWLIGTSGAAAPSLTGVNVWASASASTVPSPASIHDRLLGVGLAWAPSLHLSIEVDLAFGNDPRSDWLVFVPEPGPPGPWGHDMALLRRRGMVGVMVAPFVGELWPSRLPLRPWLGMSGGAVTTVVSDEWLDIDDARFERQTHPAVRVGLGVDVGLSHHLGLRAFVADTVWSEQILDGDRFAMHQVEVGLALRLNPLPAP